MKTHTLAAAVAAGTLLLTGCGASVSSGTVVDKRYEDAYTWYTTQCLPTANNACGSSMQVPHYEPEHWVLTLENCELRKDSSDDCPRGDVYVDPRTYDEVQLGDDFGGETR